MDEILTALSAVFTKEQQISLAVIMVGVVIVTQAFKKIYFGFNPLRNSHKKEAIIWSAAVSFGAMGGVLGYFVAIPPQPLWFWMFTGIASGGAAIGLFKVLIDIIWPRIVSKIGKTQ